MTAVDLRVQKIAEMLLAEHEAEGGQTGLTWDDFAWRASQIIEAADAVDETAGVRRVTSHDFQPSDVWRVIGPAGTTIAVGTDKAEMIDMMRPEDTLVREYTGTVAMSIPKQAARDV